MVIAFPLNCLLFGCRLYNLSLIVWHASLSSYYCSMVAVSSRRSLIHNHMNLGEGCVCLQPSNSWCLHSGFAVSVGMSGN